MRHRVYGKHLGRNKNQRTALFRSLVQSLLLSGSIETTESKAKSIKGLVDKLINQAKSPTTQRLVSQFITNKTLSEKLIKDVAPALNDRSSGYTSVLKLGRRLGDNAMVVRMSLLTSVPVISHSGVNDLSETKDLKTEAIKSIDSSPAKRDQNDKKAEKVAPKVKSAKSKATVKKQK